MSRETCEPSGWAASFDAVLVHDAVDYVTSREDLSSVVGTAFAHCRPGGLAVFAPDHTAETFRAGTGGGGGHDGTGRQASFRERTSDPVPGDDWILAEYEFTLRDADGTVRVVPEAHRLGAFRRDTWLQTLRAAGFAAEARPEFRTGTGPDPPRSCSSVAAIRVRRDAPSPPAAAVGAGRRHPRIAVRAAAAARGVHRAGRQAHPAATACQGAALDRLAPARVVCSGRFRVPLARADHHHCPDRLNQAKTPRDVRHSDGRAWWAKPGVMWWFRARRTAARPGTGCRRGPIPPAGPRDAGPAMMR